MDFKNPIWNLYNISNIVKFIYFSKHKKNRAISPKGE